LVPARADRDHRTLALAQSSGTLDADLEIRLGVTSVAVDALSEFLDDNVTSPPFVYDPEGNLLVEFLAANVTQDVFVWATDAS
jgi:hypothetical protein